MPQDLENEWNLLRDRMLVQHHDIERGKMMSADALTHLGKVFVFFSTRGERIGIGCRIGRETDITAFGLIDWQHLTPFKAKPPMKDWIVLGAGDRARWLDVASHCLNSSREKGS